MEQQLKSTRFSCYTDFVRNVTITLDDETARWARIEAARNDTSVSKLVGAMLRAHMHERTEYERAKRSYLSRKPVPLGKKGDRYPHREELYER